MDFYDILDQVIDILRSRGRMSYRALKRQFDLDDGYMEDLKEEIIYSQRLAVDEDGRVLVWIGTSATQPEPASTPPTQSGVTQGIRPTPVEPLPPEPHTPEAERRQLTVMFCDLVDSTKLSSQLDPEDYREVVRAYQSACTEVIQRYEGHIAQLLGDGLLVYFGYPQAHEDDAQRAVRTGLGILAALGDLNSRLQQVKGIQLGVRLGIHTGLVVVGDMGGVGRQEQLALGEVPNVCARIQGLAAPNTVALSEATSRLVQGYFDCEALGAQILRGVAQPFQVYHVLQESGATSRLDVAVTRGLTPLVGRESEVTLLLERWEQVKAGHGQVVLLTGDAGIGKSRLVQMLKEHVAQEPHVRWECRSAEYSQNTALFPLTDLFQRLLQFQSEETPDEKVGKLEQMLSQHRLPLAESVPLFAPLLSLPIPEDRYPALPVSPQRQRQQTLETLVAILLEHAERQPVLFIFEDLHWADPTTLELLHLVIEQIPTTSVCMVLTCRPTFQPSWSHRSYVSEITVSRLSHAQVEQIVTGMTDGKTLPHEVLAQIIEKTDGVPLFVEEMTKAILESGHLKAVDGHYALIGSFSTFVIPATLQDALMARLDRLVTAKAVAQYAAVIGRQFSYELLQAVSRLDAVTLQRELRRLVEAEIVYQRGVSPQATYTFKHALIQDTAYASLLKSTRQQYHQRIAQVLEEQCTETAETEPELLAHHYAEAGLVGQAIAYWQRAGQQATERSANLEAVQHLTTALSLLATLPETGARAQQELALQLALGAVLSATKGQAAPEVEHTYARARALCAQVSATPQLFPTLWGLWRFYRTRGMLPTAHELGEQLLGLAQRAADPTHRLAAHAALGETCLYLGDYAAARTHLEQGVGLMDPATQRAQALHLGVAPGVVCLATAAKMLWCLGYPAQALRRSQEALALAQTIAHPPSLCNAHIWGALLHLRRHEVAAVLAQAEALLTLATAQGFPLYVGFGLCCRGWGLAVQGQGAAGLAQMHQGLAGVLATGQRLARPRWLTLLADAAGYAGQIDEGWRVLVEARAAFEESGQGHLLAETYRLQGTLLLRQAAPDMVHAEACFQQALTVARHQQAKSWELRTATSLARLWQQQGKRAEAYELLAPVYGWFTEGFDTADLQEAKALLGELTV